MSTATVPTTVTATTSTRQQSIPSSAYRALVFDFGGVLVRTASQQVRHQWEARLGLAAGELERRVHQSAAWQAVQRGQMDETVYWQQLGTGWGLAPAQLAQLRAAYFQQDQLDPHLHQLLLWLRQAGYRLGLLSNDGPDLRRKLRQVYQLADLFDQVVISAELGAMKPDPFVYQVMLDRLAVPAAATIFIDDLPLNVAGAQAVGLTGLVFTSTPQLWVDLQRLLPPLPPLTELAANSAGS